MTDPQQVPPWYVERGGEIVYSPPGIATGVRMYAWMLAADATDLQQMYDRYLNDPSQGHVSFRPAGSAVVLNFTTMRHIGALTKPDSDRGFFSEGEVAIWTLGVDELSKALSTFIAYMWVDQGAALAMGREVYGFPKQLGRLQLPADSAAPEFRLETSGVEEWGQRQQFDQHQVIRVVGDTPIDFGGLEGQFETQVELIEGLSDLLGHDPGIVTDELRGDALGGDALFAARTAQLLADQILPTVFLKQFRDIHQPLMACYQAVATAQFEVTGFHGAGILPGKWQVHIVDLANEPIRREFGFQDGPLEPIAAFWVDFDFTLSIGEELWRAPEPPRDLTLRQV